MKPDATHHLLPGTLIHGGVYRIVRFIASGGFGCTYEAVNVTLGKRVAVKELFISGVCERDETTGTVTVGRSNTTLLTHQIERFIKEAHILAELHHHGVVGVEAVFEERGTAYYVMDYIDGESLSQMRGRRGPIPEAEALGYIRQTAEAMAYVHAKGQLHLDIKPGNLMVDSSGRVTVIDFGMAKHIDTDSGGVTTQTIMGQTPGYAPLELSTKDTDMLSPASDVYSLGATLYALLTGVRPPDAVKLSLGAPVPEMPAHISESVRRAIRHAMAMNPRRRPQSMDEFLSELTDAENPADDDQEETRPNLDAYNIARRSKKFVDRWPVLTTMLMLFGFFAIGTMSLVILYWPTYSLTEDGDPALPEEPLVTGPVHWDILTHTLCCDTLTYTLVKVPGGSFVMGDHSGRDSEALPLHTVTLDSYYLGRTEVPQWLWVAVMGENPSSHVGRDLPVDRVSWNDCQVFIDSLNALTGARFRLPTEAEWEFAAREGRDNPFPAYLSADSVNQHCWTVANNGRVTHPALSLRPNALGLYNMVGNIYELCHDGMARYTSKPAHNPRGDEQSMVRVARGGGPESNDKTANVSYRKASSPGSGSGNGLRLAL